LRAGDRFHGLRHAPLPAGARPAGGRGGARAAGQARRQGRSRASGRDHLERRPATARPDRRDALEAAAGRAAPPARRHSLVMIVMTPDATDAQVAAVKQRLETIERLHVLVLPGELTTAIGAIGDPEGVAELGLEGMPGVDRVVPISRPYKLASSELSHFEPTIVEVDGHRIGAPDTFCLIAGPCTVESREQTLAVARAVAASGAAILRGGAFKPRTSPFAFKGLGVPGLEILSEARAETGLSIVTELLDTQHADVIHE